MHRPMILLVLIALLGSSLVVATIPTAEAVSPAALECASNPFGNVVTLGGEHEVFVGFRGGFGTASSGWVQHDRLDLGAGVDLERRQEWLGGEGDAALRNISWLTSASGDFDNNGTTDYAQAFVDANGATRYVLNEQGNAPRVLTGVGANHQYLALAGQINRDARDRLVLASRTGAGSLNVQIINPNGNTVLATWRSREGTFENPRDITIVTGDLDGNGSNDEIVVAFRNNLSNGQIVVLKHAPGHFVDGGALKYESNMRAIASTELLIGTPMSVKVAVADLDNKVMSGSPDAQEASDARAEIVYAQENFNQSTPGLGAGIQIRTLNLAKGANQLVVKGGWSVGDQTSDLSLAAGDTDLDSRAEIVLAYRAYGSNSGLAVQTLDAESATIREYNRWRSSDNFRLSPQFVSIAVGDLNKDGNEIIAAFRDAGNQIQVVRLQDQEFNPASPPPSSLQLVSTYRDGSGGRTGATQISVQLADWDNDSLKAHYAPATGGTLKCKTVVEPNITAAVFTPPYWAKIQEGQARFGSIGRSKTREKTDETAFTFSRSHSVSGYFGGKIDGEVASASAKVTFGYEYATASTSSGSFTTGTTTSEGWINYAGSFVVMDNTTSDCYSYQLREGDTDVDGVLRFCEFKRSDQLAPTLNTWEQQYGPRNNPGTRQWTPVTRDWANLALFRGDHAVQSSNLSATGGAARLAVDGNTDGNYASGSVTHTARNQEPTWWQVDLVRPSRSARCASGTAATPTVARSCVRRDSRTSMCWSRTRTSARSRTI
jgi:hypothetical protein